MTLDLKNIIAAWRTGSHISSFVLKQHSCAPLDTETGFIILYYVIFIIQTLNKSLSMSTSCFYNKNWIILVPTTAYRWRIDVIFQYRMKEL